MSESKNKEPQIVQLTLPFGGKNGEKMVKKLKRNIERTTSNKVNLRVTYTPFKCDISYRLRKQKMPFSVRRSNKMPHYETNTRTQQQG